MIVKDVVNNKLTNGMRYLIKKDNAPDGLGSFVHSSSSMEDIPDNILNAKVVKTIIEWDHNEVYIFIVDEPFTKVYTVSYIVSGTYLAVVEATSPEEARALADINVSEQYFGYLENMEYERISDVD